MRTVRTRRADSNAAKRAAATEWLRKIKRKMGCAHCGIKDPRVLDFHHHNRAEKSHNISDMVVRGFPEEAIRAELAKCTLLCANCHRLEHRRKPTRRNALVRVPVSGCRKRHTPRLCRHKTSGRAYVTDPLTRQEVYFGPWGSRAARQGYEVWLGTLRRTAARCPLRLPTVPQCLRPAERQALCELEQVAAKVVKAGTLDALLLDGLTRAVAEVEQLWTEARELD
jgi:hypothetical protein